MNQPAGATVVPPAQPGNAPPVDPNTVIQLALSVGQINKVLHYLGKQPLEEVLDVFNAIQGQGNMALAAMKMGGGVAAEPQSGEKIEDPPAENAPNKRRRN